MRDDMTIKNRTVNHLKILASFLWISFFFIIFCILYRQNIAVIYTLIFFYLLNIVPGIFLHVSYYLEDKGKIINIKGDEFCFTHKGRQFSWFKQDITKITVFMTPGMYRKSSFQLLTFESYIYAKISLKLEEDILITNLLVPELETFLSEFSGIPYVRKKVLFPNLPQRDTK